MQPQDRNGIVTLGKVAGELQCRFVAAHGLPETYNQQCEQRNKFHEMSFMNETLVVVDSR